jgi:hypothetical protein
MPWTAPSDPVTGTVITVAYAVANLLTQLRHLRLMTGNADPPGSSYVVVSDSAGTTSWRKVTNDVLGVDSVAAAQIQAGAVGPSELAAGAAVANIGYRPVNAAGDAMSGTLAIVGNTGTGNNLDALDLVQQGVGNSGVYLRLMTPNGATTIGHFYGNSVLQVLDLNGTPAIDMQYGSTHLRVYNQTVYDAGNIGTASVANAAQVGGRTPTATPAAGAIPIADGAGKLDAWITAGGTATNAAALNSQPGSFYQARANHTGTQPAATISDLPATVATLGAQTAVTANNLQGIPPSTTAAANRIPVSDASGKLDAWVTPASFSIPSGLGCWVRSASEIPTGFARETSLDGLMLVGAGTSFGQTFNETQSYGNTWAHQHTSNSFAVSVSSVSVSVSVSGSATGGAGDTTGSSTAINGLATAGGVNLNTTGHTHPLNGVSLAVSASGGGSGTGSGTATGSTSNATWIPPLRAVVYARKT